MSGSYTADKFLNDELARLNAKQKQASQLAESQLRLTLLNDSYRKRYAKYVEILMVLVIAYILYLGMQTLQTSVPGIPSWVFDLFIILLIFILAYYLYFAFSTLQSRNVTNYDELNITSLSDGSGVDAQSLLNRGQLSQAPVGEVCVGQDCCPEGYVWDLTKNKCVIISTATGSAAPTTGSVAGFTTLEYSFVERQHETRFDDPSLKRSPEPAKLETTYSDTNLRFSPIELSK